MVAAYIDIRPFIFLAGLPVFIATGLLAAWVLRLRWGAAVVSLGSAAVFVVLFFGLLTGLGPFVDQNELRTYQMTWRVETLVESGLEHEVVTLRFVDFPDHAIVEYSRDLAEHLRRHGEAEVAVVFSVTSDYGRVRGYWCEEVAGLTRWRSSRSIGQVSGSGEPSPW